MESTLLFNLHQILLLFILTPKKTFRIVLMAVCDAKYKFTQVDITDTGRQSVDSLYVNSYLRYAIENGLLNIPQPSKLPQSERILPSVFIGDDACDLRNHLMKPYPFQNLSLTEKVFNYRSSRARRVFENAFGVAPSRFRVLHRPMIAKPATVISITKTIVALHNSLMSSNLNDSYSYCPPGFIDQDDSSGIIECEWRREKEKIWDFGTLNL